jgi:hypothetical protein
MNPTNINGLYGGMTLGNNFDPIGGLYGGSALLNERQAPIEK